MERSREARRPNTVAENGPPSRRRRRTTSLRGSPEDVHVELQETVRLRDQAIRRERDRDVANKSKRRRVERSVHASNREGGGDESVGGEDDNEAGKRGSHSYHNQRKSFHLARDVTSAPPESMAVDEIIGFAVPRKARSSSVKRSHEYWFSGNVSTSPARRSGEAAPPSSSDVSVGEKLKGALNVPKSSTSSQEDFEIEIAEVLFGLKKQSQSSKKESSAPISSQKLKSKYSNDLGTIDGGEQLAKRPIFTSEKHEDPIVASVSMEPQKVVADLENLRLSTIESGSRDGLGRTETIGLAKDVSPSCPKLDVDLQDSAMTKGTSSLMEVKNKQENIKINMKAPAMASSLGRDGLVDLGSKLDRMAQDDNMKKETPGMEEAMVGVQETKVKPIQENSKLLTIDLEKEYQDQGLNGDNVGSSKLEQSHEKQQLLADSTIPKEDKTAPPSSSALTNSVAGWAKNSLPPPGYISPQPIDENTGTSKELQPPQFPLSKPRTKRCTTHQYIASNIHLHQQLVETNKLCPAPAGSASLYGTAPCNLKPMLPTTPLQGSSMAVNVNPTHGRSSEATNSSDNAHKKQAVFQQTPQPAPAGNLMHGPAFFFPLSQNQATIATTATQSSKSAISVNNASSSNNSAAKAPQTSTPLPAVAAAMSFNYPNIAANGAPCVAIMQNNGYPLPISTHFGTAPPFIGGAPAQAMSFYNGSFYSPHLFHPGQLQHQQPHSQPAIVPASSGSSSSHKKPQTRQLNPSSRQSDVGYGNNGGKHVDKQRQQLQQQSSKNGVKLIPQAFTVSFASNDNAMASNINFSAAHNPAHFQSLPEVARQGYLAAAAQMAQQKNYQISEEKTGNDTKNPEGGRKAGTGQTRLFNNSAGTLNFMSPNYQQQQLHQLHKQHTMHQQHGGTAQNKAPTWRDSAANQASHAPSASDIASSSGSTSKFLPQRGKSGQGQNQISFEGVANQAPSTSVAESPPRTASTTSQSQQADNATRNAQKSSPVCGRNVPSILSTCSGHLNNEIEM